ncbi:MAG: hypothetical protein QNK37_37410, partial [Acidobacteriota bacterium]|nr:hypothetical protein [Acidobacteriota bacterium]
LRPGDPWHANRFHHIGCGHNQEKFVSARPHKKSAVFDNVAGWDLLLSFDDQSMVFESFYAKPTLEQVQK